MYTRHVGRHSSVGIATRCGLDGPGIESRWGSDIFCTRPDQPIVPPSLLYNGYRVFTGDKATRAWLWPPTPSNTDVKEEVELYISALGLRGLLYGEIYLYLYTTHFVHLIISDPDYDTPYGNWATGWTVRGPNPGRGHKFFCSWKSPDPSGARPVYYLMLTKIFSRE